MKAFDQQMARIGILPKTITDELGSNKADTTTRTTCSCDDLATLNFKFSL
jgi:hypothetical protein